MQDQPKVKMLKKYLPDWTKVGKIWLSCSRRGKRSPQPRWLRSKRSSQRMLAVT